MLSLLLFFNWERTTSRRLKKQGGGSSGGTLCDQTLDPSLPFQEYRCFPYGEEVLFEIMEDTVSLFSRFLKVSESRPSVSWHRFVAYNKIRLKIITLFLYFKVWIPFREYNIPS